MQTIEVVSVPCIKKLHSGIKFQRCRQLLGLGGGGGGGVNKVKTKELQFQEASYATDNAHHIQLTKKKKKRTTVFPEIFVY